MLPIEVLAEERKAKGKVTTTLSPGELGKEERLNSIRRWQSKWDTSTKGRWTYRLISQVDVWVNRNHGGVNYYLTQMISGYGCYRAYLYKYKCLGDG
ncbi:unnamed protein product [Arctia plantaginis]|uniref:Uncharacterized protein n=1 Tax=Arctia plantaginis TaxID=874455 RepID=A0A8S1B2I8_ARCPL|nr:unnamed protein product [Arctia plantaginis]